MLRRLLQLGLVGLVIALGPIVQPSALAGPDDPPGAALSLRLNPGPSDRLNAASFDIVGLDSQALDGLRQSRWTTEQWSQCFSVTADDPTTTALQQVSRPPLAGRYAIAAGVVRFTPSAPLEGGRRYRATLRLDRLPAAPAGQARVITALFSLPERP